MTVRIIWAMLAVALAGHCWLQLDTWKEARETNRFILELVETVRAGQ